MRVCVCVLVRARTSSKLRLKHGIRKMLFVSPSLHDRVIKYFASSSSHFAGALLPKCPRWSISIPYYNISHRTTHHITPKKQKTKNKKTKKKRKKNQITYNIGSHRIGSYRITISLFCFSFLCIRINLPYVFEASSVCIWVWVWLCAVVCMSKDQNRPLYILFHISWLLFSRSEYFKEQGSWSQTCRQHLVKRYLPFHRFIVFLLTANIHIPHWYLIYIQYIFVHLWFNIY